MASGSMWRLWRSEISTIRDRADAESMILSGPRVDSTPSITFSSR